MAARPQIQHHAARAAALALAVGLVLAGCGEQDSKRSERDRARDYYQRHQDEFRQPKSRLVGHILVDDAQTATRLYRQLRGKDRTAFARMARRHSIDRSSSRDGGTITVYQGQSLPAIDTTAFRLKTGQLSRPFKSPAGYHLLLALEPTQPARVRPFDEVRTQIEAELRGSTQK